ncbi:MAG: mechanosensitive ion channel [Chloroflexi bacterium]|nr:MAG: mechanosensitive ion channel [Chloroflexota bacterium]
METNKVAQDATREIYEFLFQPNDYRTVLILIASIIFAYWVSRFLAKGIVFIAQKVAVRSDAESREDKQAALRQVETYLSVAVAAVRAIVVAIVAYVVWILLAPQGSQSFRTSGAAAIGASAFFIVVAGQTLGIVLRDITSGATMIIEKWFNVGDYIKVEPFIDVTGVVERLTLRSTKLRSLSGEVIWVHNQKIDAVHVTPRGVRTMAVDIFVHDRVRAEKEIGMAIATIPTGATMLARPLRIKYSERWGDDLWRITVVGQTAPGREWLIEKYFVNALKEIDAETPRKDRLLIHEPIARFADSVADSKFKRAVRVNKDK